MNTSSSGLAPHQFQRRVLLLVTGLSPQVVTETVFALTQTREPAFVPTEVRVITTVEGRNKLALTLLSDDLGWFRRLRTEWALPDILFTLDQVHVMPGPTGAAMEDIRTEADNQAAADFITEQVRQITADEGCALHVSMAGGRKTMGFFAGYALSLFGRPQDRLSHVLVSEPFEQSLDFFYPSATQRVLTLRDGKTVADAAHATVMLADIPFVSLRQGLPKDLLKGKSSFSAGVAAAQRAIGPQALVIDRKNRRIRWGEVDLKLPPNALALLCVLARRSLERLPPLAAPAKSGGTPGCVDEDLSRAWLAELDGIGSGPSSATADRLREGVDGEYFSTALSRLRSALHAAFGPQSVQLIDNGGKRPFRFSVALPPELIRFDDSPPLTTTSAQPPRTRVGKTTQ